jgi:hypothetical protein
MHAPRATTPLRHFKPLRMLHLLSALNARAKYGKFFQLLGLYLKELVFTRQILLQNLPHPLNKSISGAAAYRP